MNIQEALDIMLTHRKFLIRRYHGQDGRVWDISVELLADGENYTHLVQRALGVTTQIRNAAIPEDADPGVWAQALKEQESSWLAHMSSNDHRRAFSDRKSVLHYEPLNPRDIEEGLIITEILCERVQLEGKPQTPVSALAIAKAKIRDMTEVVKFTSKLILTPGKFESVEGLIANQ